VYLLGHMAMGYLFAWVVAKERKQRLVIWAALTAAIFPDYDILFRPLGLMHHTYTHSLVLWAPVMIALVYWKRGSLPYVVAVLQHIVLGDTLVGRVPLFLPLSKVQIGLNLGMPSMADILLEVRFSVLALLVLWRSGDLRRVFGGGSETVLMAVLLLSVALMGLLWRGTARLEGGGFGLSRLRLWGLPLIDVVYIGLTATVVVAMLFVLLALLRRPLPGSEGPKGPD
jgi:hypothetical protein